MNTLAIGEGGVLLSRLADLLDDTLVAAVDELHDAPVLGAVETKSIRAHLASVLDLLDVVDAARDDDALPRGPAAGRVLDRLVASADALVVDERTGRDQARIDDPHLELAARESDLREQMAYRDLLSDIRQRCAE